MNAVGVVDPFLEEAFHVSQGVGHVSVDHEVFEDFYRDSTSGLQQGCSLSAEVLVSNNEPD